MDTSTVTSKGQITIPKAVREALNLAPGDRVLFVRHHDGRVTMVPQNVDLRSLIGSVQSDVRGVTLDDIEEGIAEGALAGAGFAASRRARGTTPKQIPAKRGRPGGRKKPAAR